jgi:hypothetical protein
VTLEAHDDAEVVLATADAKPLLARRNVGLGRAWMFAADLGGRYTSAWRAWPDAPRLVSQVVRDAVARGGEPPLRLSLSAAPGGHAIELSATDAEGRPRNGLDATAEVLRETGEAVLTLRLTQIAPGRYRGAVEDAALAEEDGDLTLTTRVDDVVVATRALRPPALRERQPGPPDIALLERIAAATTGRYDPADEQILERREVSRAALWPPFAAAALVLFLLELLVRRTGWPRRAPPSPP